jgi:hypothetical protein
MLVVRPFVGELLRIGKVDLPETILENWKMDWTFLTGALAFVTLSAAIVFAFWSKRKTDQRMDDPKAEKSTLAKDKPSDDTPADV